MFYQLQVKHVVFNPCFSLMFFFVLAGLRPGLLAKFQAAQTADQKFQFLRAFMLDPTHLGSLSVESEYKELDTQESESKWIEKPLYELEKLYNTPELKRFLQTKILDRQAGRNHPQDPTGEDGSMKLYWIYQETTDSTGKKKHVGTSIKAACEIPQNKAARAAMGDGLLGRASEFGKGGKGSTPGEGFQGDSKGKGSNKGKKGGKNNKQVRICSCKHMFVHANFERYSKTVF